MANTKQLEIVPFGKYKNQPVEVLAADKSYCEWLVAQDWVRERFPSVHTLIVNHFGEPEETPEHNALQIRFMDKNLREKATFFGLSQRYGKPSSFMGNVSDTTGLVVEAPVFERGGIDVVWDFSSVRFHGGGISGEPLEIPSSLNRKEEGIEYIFLHDTSVKFNTYESAYEFFVKRFLPEDFFSNDLLSQLKHLYPLLVFVKSDEVRNQNEEEFCNEMIKRMSDEGDKYGRDKYCRTIPSIKLLTILSSGIRIVRYYKKTYPHWEEYDAPFQRVGGFCYRHISITVECKPTLSDEYPAVLRQILTNKENGHISLLVIERFMAVGATFDQVKQFFKASSIYLCTIEELLSQNTGDIFENSRDVRLEVAALARFFQTYNVEYFFCENGCLLLSRPLPWYWKNDDKRILVSYDVSILLSFFPSIISSSCPDCLKKRNPSISDRGKK